MAIHDWTRVPGNLFHHFHQNWMVKLCDALNDGVMPPDYYALIEQKSAGVSPDILSFAKHRSWGGRSSPRPVVKPLTGEPRVKFKVRQSENSIFVKKANRIGVHNYQGELIAIIELVSPGNKDGNDSIAQFVRKTLMFLNNGVNALIIDLLQPTKRDPQGIHKRIWDEIDDEPFKLPKGKRLTLASYRAGPPTTAYVEPVAIGDALPSMPLFLDEYAYIETPLEQTYQLCWEKTPVQYRELILNPELCK